MNKQDLMKKAHKLAKEIVSMVGDYLVSLKIALKKAWSEIKGENAMKLTEEQENLAWEKAALRVKKAKKYGINKTAEDFIEVCREDVIDKIKDRQEKEAEEAQKLEVQKAASKKASNGRYLELLSVAQRDKLNHGKAWVCGEIDIQTKGGHPSWEDELVCYIYK